MTKEPERVQLTVITQEIEDSDDLPGTLSSSGDGASAGGGESSEGEGDIEIEHIGDETTAGGVHGLLPTGNITFDVRRRTLINIYQRTILEEFYRCGMTSASLMLNHLHTAAAEKTGLDVTVVKVNKILIITVYVRTASLRLTDCIFTFLTTFQWVSRGQLGSVGVRCSVEFPRGLRGRPPQNQRGVL